MRFFKIFLISFGSLIGIIGSALGIMYLTGSFTEPVVQPTNIQFIQNTYEVTDDFEMTITTSTEDVTETKVTLSFAGSYTEDNEMITNGIITVPKYVHIGTPFTVTLNKESKLIGTERLAWIKGGISTLKATSTNVSARVAETKVYVDVPVYDLTIETMATLDSQSQSTFNINSSFWAKVNFLPAESAYAYSKDGSDGNSVEYKTVFFSILSNALTATANSTHNSQQYSINQVAQSVNITAQVFSSIKTEIEAYALFEEYSPELIKSQILALLDGIDDYRKSEAIATCDFEELLVGQYTVNNSNVPSEFNRAVQIFANKQTTQELTHNLGIQILANDNQTNLQSEIKNIGIAIAVQGSNGFEPVLDSQFVINGRDFTYSTINQKQYKFYFPYVHQTNINQSYWEIIALQENINAKLIIVLFDEVETGHQLNAISLNNGNFKYSFDIDPTQIISNQVYWTNPAQTNTILYIYDNINTSQILYQQYDLKTLPYAIPSENSYKSVVYFAYLEEQGGIISSQSVSSYINVGSKTAVYQYGSNQTVILYEIPNGVITPKGNIDFPEGSVIKVVLATVKTNYDGSYIFEEGKYVVDKFSSLSSLGTLQTLSFEIAKTLKTIDAYLEYDSNNAVLSGSTLAVVGGTENAFNVVFDVTEAEQKSIFVRDYNDNRISLVFKINNVVVENLFTYSITTFDEEDLTFAVSINVDYLTYQLNDPGYRNFTVEVSYTRGYESEVYIPIVSAAYILEGITQSVSEPTFEVYDGKIATLSFANDLSAITQQNPITVRTSLDKDTESNHSEQGISYALEGSTNSFILNGSPLIKDQLFVSSTNKVSIKAYDKYGREITDESLWTLVSEDETNKILTVDATGQSLNYLGTSVSPIRVYITSNNGVGGRVVNSSNSIYFNVETLGKIVYVAYNNSETAENYQSIYSNYDQANYSAVDGTFALNSADSVFSQNSISLDIIGKENRVIDLSNLHSQTNLLKLYYALPSATQGRYEIFDLLKITKFVREDSTSFDGFIQFDYTDETNTYISSFSISKNFGQTGYLNLKAITDIGISISVRIEIQPNINVVVGEYGHQNDGAQGGLQYSISYTGVYANYEISVQFDFSLLEGTLQNLNAFRPLLYNFDTKTVIAHAGSDPNIITVFGNKATVSFVIDDVAGATYNHYVFVLHSGASFNTTNYSKNTYDYSRDLYLRVNPNITAELNTDNEDVSSSSTTEASITVVQTDIMQVVAIVDDPTALINVSRIIGTGELNLTGSSSNYVIARITNASSTPVSSAYFSLNQSQQNDNILRLIRTITNSETIYISVFHYVNASTYYMIARFKITITPDIIENENSKDNFVTYSGTKYLQLEADAEYDFDTLAGYFAISKDTENYNLKVSFEPIYANQTTYWQISGNKIYIRPSTVIISNRLVATIQIVDIGTINFPIIIMPRTAPLVFYDTTPNDLTANDILGGLTHMERNILANSDLANLLSVDYLVANDIYDTVPDGLTFADGFTVQSKEEQPFGLYPDDMVLYSIRNGNGGFEGTEVASILSDGTLATNFVGQDTYIIIVASIKGLNVYYRLKIIASLSLNTYYPYGDNDSEETVDKAEYILYKTTDSAKTITLNESFTSNMPASSFEIPSVYKVDAENGNGYSLNTTYITNRLMMFRKLNLEDENAKFPMNFAIESVLVYSVQLGLMTDESRTAVASANFVNYVVASFDELTGKIYVTLKNVTSYVAVVQIKTTTGAIAYYTFAVEQSSRTYTVVEGTEGQYISQMPTLAQNYEINIESPVSYATEGTTLNVLQNLYLKATMSSSSQDRTDLLRFHIYNGKDLLSIEDKVIHAQFSVSSVFASLVLYTKYGVLRTIPLTLESLIKVVDFDTDTQQLDPQQNITQKFSDTVYSGSTYDLSEIVKFIQVDDPIQEVEEVEWTSITIEGTQPNYIVRLGNSSILILPLNEGVSHTVVLKVSVLLFGDKEFNFDFTLTILSPITSNHHDSLQLTPLANNFYGGGNILIYIFGEDGFYTLLSEKDLSFTANGNNITSELDDGYNYTLNVLAISGASAISSTRSIDGNGKLVLSANGVADETEVIVQATLTMSTTINGSYFEFSCVSYLLFVVRPDSTVETNYPILNNAELPFESIYYGNSSINLNESASFQTWSRVVITPRDEQPKQSYVNYKISAGDPDLIVKNNVSQGGNGLDNYDFDSSFTFEFELSSTYTYATVDFEIFVSGISRAIYTVKVYKNINSIYGIKINTINTVEGSNEVFYLGEDRTDIFNGIQAFTYTISSSLQNAVSVQLYNGSSQLGITLSLITADRGINKTFKVAENYSVLNGLTLSNIRFKIGTQIFTYAQMSQNLYFAMEQDGSTAFKIVRRAEITYLGVEIIDEDFLNAIQISETGQAGDASMSSYKISFLALGHDVTESSGLISFKVGSESLGSYSYKVKVNVVVENDSTIEIMAGERLTNLMSVLGVKKVNGDLFVTYSGSTTTIDEKVVNAQIIFEVSINTIENTNTPKLYNADTDQPYDYIQYGASVSPIQYSINWLNNPVSGQNYTYDFELTAIGAPNSGIYGNITFKYTVIDLSNGTPYEFEKVIKVLISPNWNIILLNGSGGENTENTPEVITSENFGSENNFTHVLVNKFNTSITKVFALKTNDEQTGNLALSLAYKIIYPEIYLNKASLTYTIQSTEKIAVGVILVKPEFAIRDVMVEISDVYGYKVIYYYKVQPDTLITYGSMSNHNSVYEGDSFMIEHSEQGDVSNIDHMIILSTSDFSTSSVVQIILKTSDGVAIDAVDPSSVFGIAITFNLKYIDEKWFSENTRTVAVYFEIHLMQNSGDEAYVIRGDTFVLHQRYSIVVNNIYVRDGADNQLIDHIDIEDIKAGSYLGVPQFLNEKTLVLSQSMHGKIFVSAIDSSSTSYTFSFDVNETLTDNQLKYYMLAELSNGIVSDVSLYTFVVSKIIDSTLGITLAVESEYLTIARENELNTNAYVVHLYNGTQYKDVTITTSTVALGSTHWSILGYEELANSVAINVEKEIAGTVTIHKIKFSQTPQNNVTLKLSNTGTVSDGIDNIQITQSSDLVTWYITYKMGNLDYDNESIDTGELNEEFSIPLNNIVGDNSNWIITSMEFGGNNSPFIFNIKNDKKLVITTVEKLIGENEYKTIQVDLNGTDYITVELDTNGRKAISYMEYRGWGNNTSYNPSNYALSSTNSISMNDLLEVKDMTYYDDTLELTFGSSNKTANISFRLTRIRDGVYTNYDFGITLKTYKFSYALGLSKVFSDMIQVGDTYRITVTAIQPVELSSLTVKWPNQSESESQASIATSNYTTADFGVYAVDDIEDVKIEDGLQTFNIESALRYSTEKSNGLVTIPRYYIVKFNDAFHVLDATNFRVSPYYYQMTNIYSSGSQRVVTDYSQIISGGQQRYKVEFETWAKNITFKDSQGNAILTDTLISAKNDGIMKFSVTAGGSGSADFDDTNNYNLITDLNIQLGLTYFTIKVSVALNGDPLTNEWLEIGEIILTLDSYPNYNLQPKDVDNNPIGYTISLDKNNVNGELEETMIRYFQIESNDTAVMFSTNSLFSSENIASYGSKRTTVADLTNVYLAEKTPAYYQISYQNSNNIWFNTTLKSTFVNQNQYPYISAINIGSGVSVTLELKNGENTYNAVFTNNDLAIINGSIPIENFTFPDNYTYDTLPYGIQNYTITSANDGVSVAWTKVDLTSLISLIGSHFYGDGTVTGDDYSNEDVVSLLKVSNVYKLKKLDNEVTVELTTPITTVDVLVEPKSGNVKTTEYYAVTQIKTEIVGGSEILKSSQTYVYKVENNTDLQLSVTIPLLTWNQGILGETIEYTDTVIIEKLTNFESFTGPTAIKQNGTYEYLLGTKYAEGFDEKITIVKNGSLTSVGKIDLSNEIVVDFYGISYGYIATNIPAIYTRRVTEENITVEATGKVLNIIHKDNDVYTYDYYYNTAKTISKPTTENLIILKSSSIFAGTLIWHELMNGDLPLGVIYYSVNGGAMTPVPTITGTITGLENGDVVSNLWNGVLINETSYPSDTYMQITYGAGTEQEEIVYFQFGLIKRNNSNDLKIGELFKDEFGDYLPLDYTLFGELQEYTTELTDYVADYGIYVISYDDQVYAVLNYSNSSNYNLFDLIYEDNSGQNAFRSLRSSKITVVYYATPNLIGWTVTQTGYYAFEYNGQFVVQNLEYSLDFNLFNIFGIDLILTDNGEVTISKLVDNFIAYESLTQETMNYVYIRVEDSQNSLITQDNTRSLIYDSELGKYVILINLNETFMTSLTSTTINYYQTDTDQGEPLTTGNLFSPVEYSLIVSTETINFNALPNP